VREVFAQEGPGVITHIWFTIAARSGDHLKELVLRGYWDGSTKPSVEAPVGDFFGLNLNAYTIYESQYLACSPGRSLNAYFAMPYRRSARFTVTNEGTQEVGAFYSNIDFMRVPRLPEDALYFHAQYRQAAPCVAVTGSDPKLNPDGRPNYVYMETRGRGHLMGVTLGVLLNANGWWGEGDDMIFIDDEDRPSIVGTGSEDYFLGSWNFGGRDGAIPFSHAMYGAPLIVNAERTGGRYCCYRWHGDNPVTFNRSLKHTMEHGHANDRGDNFYSCAYWYQSAPFTDFPSLPVASQRIPVVRTA
jgi:D-arabinan exo alpha-(1,3)/(1,5)-arabinofuranosidase (non-reducing end)